MGMGSGSRKRKAAYDPQHKWGLQPANGSVGSPSSSQLEGGEGPTYVVAGHIVAGGAAGKHDMFLKEKVGREAQARAARRTNSRDTDVALKRLLARDSEGMEAVQEARKFAMKEKAREKQQRVANGKEVGKEEEGDDSDNDSESSGIDDEEDDALTLRSGHSAAATADAAKKGTKNQKLPETKYIPRFCLFHLNCQTAAVVFTHFFLFHTARAAARTCFVSSA